MKNSTLLLVFMTIGMFSMSNVFGQYDYLAIVGDAAPVGYVPQGDPMTQDQSDPNGFTYEGVFKPGNFKIHAFNGDWCEGEWLNSSVNNQDLNATDYIVTTGCDGPDNQWQVTQKGNYAVTVDLTAETIVIEPLDYYPNLFLLGDATTAGWDMGLAPEMTVDPSNPAVFAWTGTLSAGNFKIGTAKTFDSGWDWIHPLTQGQTLSSTSYEVVEAGSGSDNQWVIDSETAGEYSITVDLAAGTIAIEDATATSIGTVNQSEVELVIDKTNGKLITFGLDDFNYTIYNISGNQVNKGYSAGQNIDISALKTGIYILKIDSQTAGNHVFKFVVN